MYSTYPREVARNVPEILRVLKGVQFQERTGRVVLAGWMPGDPALFK